MAGQATDDDMAHSVACWTPKAINTHSGFAILIPFPQQQLLRERGSMLRYTYIA
jgi:hypothetical protein